MVKYIIDRFEGDFAVCEVDVGKTVDIRADLLPSDAKEGDVIVPDGGRYKIIIDEETEQRKQDVREQIKRLWR